MKTGTRQVVVYTVIRVGIFAVALGVLLALQVNPYIAAIVAAVIGFCVSYLVLSRQRAAVVQKVADLRGRASTDDDSEAENAAIDRRERSSIHPENQTP